ncbi:ADAM 17-like protease isoform X2 [Tribolium castaneum]|uniref:ADAM 17-like protease isoform X2 n=1 Tax=Tribolium castaneum TaxID=7070 RepID=UPI0000D556CD|nr:PREDICTED: ADAM 17-like protease isoform X2 [Tribolium castaneum]|eukprot:XP_974673.1 PREDICTED: ADAM 17-like protease isoform X2 [Tribolium castaneum]
MDYFLLFTIVFIGVEGSIYKNLKHFETIHANEITHKVVKRGTTDGSHPFNKIKEVNFYTHGRDFRLILTPKRSVLHSKFRAYAVDGDGKETSVHIDHDDFYHGRVFGETASHVSLHMEDGIMTGSIHLPEEIYHIEPSWRHIPHLDNKTMITYKQSDVKFSWDHDDLPPGQVGPRICGYVKEGDELEDEFEGRNQWTREHHREKRQVDQYEYTPTKTRCPLLLVADYRFFQEMGASNTKTTINYLISLIDRVHKIYNDTIWQDRQEVDGFKGMGFVIKKIVVHSEPTRIKAGEAHYNMVREKWDVRTLLEVFSREYTHKDFCLAHLFTDLKFEGGILGLAYVGSPRRNSVGGICTPEYFKNGYTLYLNSGLSSSRNHYGQRVITREADLVTAHEFGHNWGSEHDPDIPECSPSASQGGSYLMYTYSVSGYDVNNKRFSPCSLRSIRKVLQAKSGRCFSEPEESFCGNLRVEGDEECDAGLLGTEDNDACCDKDCKLRPKAVCSDKNSPCCQNCQYMTSEVKCREAQYATCEQESKCTGHQSECPKSPPMADGTNCQERGKCKGGKCIPFCETQGLQSCMCDIIVDACKRCCRSSINETCSPVDPPDILADGTPCIQGFCNKGHCEKTVQDVVERFWDIIEDININKVLLFLRDNIVGTVVLVTALLWIPTSCVINYVDRKRRHEEQERREWRNKSDLIHPSDNRRIIRIRVPRRNNT